jgi:hypothetical protein
MRKLKLSIAIKIMKKYMQWSNKQAKKKLEKRKSMMKSKQASETNDWRNCGINQGSYGKNQMTWKWPPLNTSLPNIYH